jgi:hypothetical protein
VTRWFTGTIWCLGNLGIIVKPSQADPVGRGQGRA